MNFTGNARPTLFCMVNSFYGIILWLDHNKKTNITSYVAKYPLILDEKHVFGYTCNQLILIQIDILRKRHMHI